MSITRESHEDKMKRQNGQSDLVKRMLPDPQSDDYEYRLNSGYHRFLKQKVTNLYREKAAEDLLPNPSYPYKIHLSLNICHPAHVFSEG